MTSRNLTVTTRMGITREIFANVSVALFFAFFAYSFGKSLAAEFSISALLLCLKESLDTIFFLSRKIPKSVCTKFLSWVAALLGTITPLLMRPSIVADNIIIADIMLGSGLFLQIFSILSLNRSFGIVPANRGLKKTGMYNFIRHPLYLAYTISLLGFLINNQTIFNLIVFLLSTYFQIYRIFKEEEFLSTDPEYLDYMKNTKWRMIPFLF